jgi:hypothetical protein
MIFGTLLVAILTMVLIFDIPPNSNSRCEKKRQRTHWLPEP